MAKKSIGTILGELFLAFKKGELDTDAIDVELLGMSPEAYVGKQLGTLSATKFQQFINSFTPATAEQRRAKVEALTAIKEGKKPFREFREDFSAAASDTNDETVESEPQRVASTSGANVSAPIEVQERSKASPSGREQRNINIGQTDSELVDPETYGIPEKYYNSLSLNLGFAPTEEDIQQWVASFDGTPEELFEAEAAARAYFSLMTGDVVLRPAYNDDGTPRLINGIQPLMPFPGHFKGTKVNDILDNYATADEILQFQNFITSNKLKPADYFSDSQGQMSQKLRGVIMEIMQWTDMNIHAVPGTELYESISKDPVYFSESQNLYGEWDVHRNIFNYALKELAKRQDVILDEDEAKLSKQLAEEFIPPTKSELEDMTDAYFENKLGRSATAEELDEWSTKFALSYSVAHAQALSKAQQMQDYDFMQSQPEYQQLGTNEQALANQYGVDKVIDLSMFSSASPQEIMAQQVEDEFGKQIDAVEEGRKVRQMQNDMVAYMFGG